MRDRALELRDELAPPRVDRDPGPAPLSWRATVAFALAHLLLALVGRATVIEDSLSLVWPAEGVAVLWLLADAARRQLWVLAYIGAELALIGVVSGADPLLITPAVVAVLLQTWLIVFLLRRFCPTLLGAGGRGSVEEPYVLLLFSVVVAVSCMASAAVGLVVLWAGGFEAGVDQTLLWWGRQVAGTLVVGSLGHLGWEWFSRPAEVRAHGGRRDELVLLWIAAVLVTIAVFTQPMPLLFLLVPFSVWCGIRFSTFMAALMATAIGAIAFLLTLEGQGPFVHIGDPYRSAMLTQVFVLTLLLTTLAVGAVSDRIDDLVARLRQSSLRSEAQAELLSSVTRSIEEGLVVLDASGRVVMSNPAVRRVARGVGGGDDESAVRSLLRLLSAPPSDDVRERRPELGPADVVVETGAGEVILAATTSTLVRGVDGDDQGGTVVVVHEVTDHRQGLRPLADFAATAAHDLRGPLTAITSWVEILTLDPQVEADPELGEPVARIDRAAVQMSRLIDSLLARATAEGGALSPKDVQLEGEGGVVEEVRQLLGAGERLTVRSPLPAVHADPGAVHQLLANLVGNGLKYARPDVPPLVELSAASEGGRVVVSVTDNGIGVPDGERELIFQRFQRSTAVPEHVRGSGIGLSLCRTIVERHGGRIEHLPREDGSGSVFRFDLSAAGAAPSPRDD